MKKTIALWLSLLLFISASINVFASTKQVVCVGESLTCGSGANAAGTITEPKLDSSGNPVLDSDGNVVYVNSKIQQQYTYPYLLWAKLLYSGWAVHNYGISGVSVLPEYKWEWAKAGYLGVCRSNVSNPFTFAEDHDGETIDHIFVFLGTNDAKDRIWRASQGTGGAENFYTYYTNIITSFKAIDPAPQVYCVIPPPVINDGVVNDYEIVEETLRDEITPIIRRVAVEQKCPVVDLRAAFPDPVTEKAALQEVFAVNDGAHPNRYGYDIIATEFHRMIQRLPGDIDASGVASTDDLLLFAQMLVGMDVETNDCMNEDVNLDGRIDNIDLLTLAQYFAGWDVTLY